jgi:serine/threonine-protein kinase
MDSKSAGSASDQYALGIILYESLTGRRPYDGENLFTVFQGIVGGNPKRPREYRPEIPAAMEEVVLRAMKSDAKLRFPSIDEFGRALLPFASSRARVIWEEAFTGGTTGDSSTTPGRPSIAVVPTPAPATRGSTLMPPGLANPAHVGPIPGAIATPTPGPNKTIALWGQSPVPQPRVPTGATSPGSPESEAAASVRASMVHSKSHPIVADDALEAPAPARGKKGIVIGAAAAVVVVAGGLFVLRGGSSGSGGSTEKVAAKPVEPAPPAAAAPAPPAAVPAPAPVAAAPKPPEAAKTAPPVPAEAVKPAEALAVKPTAQTDLPRDASAGSKREGKDKSRPHEHHKVHGGGAAKPAARPAGGVPVID